AAAAPLTSDHTDRETAHKSRLNHDRPQRRGLDRVCAPGERIREGSTAFPLVSSEMVKARRTVGKGNGVVSKQLKKSRKAKVEKAETLTAENLKKSEIR